MARGISRRRFVAAGLGLAAVCHGSSSRVTRALADEPTDSIRSLDHLGVFIKECSLLGETRADGVVPRHANGVQLSRDRWLIIYSTHGYRGVDDERSIVYQLRADAPDGKVVKEGFFVRAQADWRPAGVNLDGLTSEQTLFKQHGHMVAFGVPEGAKIDGQSPVHAGLFVVKWRTLGRVLDRSRNYLLHRTTPGLPDRSTQAVEWLQFRFRRETDAIEIVQPTSVLRQKGFEEGAAFCSVADAAWMNQSFTPAVPFNRARSEWADCNHFDGGRLAALKYRYLPQQDRYAWVETGPWITATGTELMEASLAPLADGWAILARQHRKPGPVWIRAADPFHSTEPPIIATEPHCNAPVTAFRCADGQLRLFTGDPLTSPYRNARDPLYCWDIDAQNNFAPRQRRVIFDSVQAHLPIRPQAVPKLDFCELLPPHDGSQLIVYGLNTRAYSHPYERRTDIPAVNAEEQQVSAIYYARAKYRDPIANAWQF